MVAALLPLVLITSALAVFNLEHVTFRQMAGMSANERTGNDGTYFAVVLLALIAQLSAPFVLIAYLWQIYCAHWRD